MQMRIHFCRNIYWADPRRSGFGTAALADLSRECVATILLARKRCKIAATIRQSDHYRPACENASDGLILQDMRGRVVWCNPAYCKMHHMKPEDVIGRNPLEFVLRPRQGAYA